MQPIMEPSEIVHYHHYYDDEVWSVPYQPSAIQKERDDDEGNDPLWAIAEELQMMDECEYDEGLNLSCDERESKHIKRRHLSIDGESSVRSIESNLRATSINQSVETDRTIFKERRRERNRAQARKSREKKKNATDALNAQLIELKKENDILKKQMNSIQTPPVDARTLIMNDFHLPDNIALLVKQLMFIADNTSAPQEMKKSSFCIVNAIASNQPIVYASPGFLRLTGYEMTDILGKNCRFLQGLNSDTSEVRKMKDAISEGRDISVLLLNYRKDGIPFWNHVQLAHLKDQSGRTFLIVGIQTKLYNLEQHTMQVRLSSNANLSEIYDSEESAKNESPFSFTENRDFASSSSAVLLQRNEISSFFNRSSSYGNSSSFP